MKCDWCSRIDNLTRVQVQPGKYTVKRVLDAKGEEMIIEDVCVKSPIFALACPIHVAAARRAEPNPAKIRYRPAAGVKQMTLYELLDQDDPADEPRQSAIFQ